MQNQHCYVGLFVVGSVVYVISLAQGVFTLSQRPTDYDAAMYIMYGVLAAASLLANTVALVILWRTKDNPSPPHAVGLP
jgi:hypothetical protein